MKILTLITLLCAITQCLLPVSLMADEEASRLDGEMKILARGMRTLSAQIADPSKKQENLVLLSSLKKAALDSKTLEPRQTADIAESRRAAFLSDYKDQMDRLEDVFAQIEKALNNNDESKAASLLSTVTTIKKEGHSKFKKD